MRHRHGFLRFMLWIGLSAAALGAASFASAGEWPRWRGPAQTGESDDTGLVSSWSVGGENLLWKADFIGRSTPVVFDGRVCAIGRTGTGVTKQEVVTCWDAFTGKPVWEARFNVYHTAVPFSRVGWANIEADPATGYLYAHGVGGLMVCLDRQGKVVWSRSLTEEFGHISGYGGRTHSPIVDEERLILTFSNSGWGDQVPPRHRTFAFDKRTGDLLYVTAPGGRPETITTQATPVVAEIGGQRLLIGPNGDGWIHAIKARTGEKVWSFHLSKQGLNTSVVVDGHRVYATSGDENVDEPTKGRIVCIDGRGTGDITKTGEIWRADEIEVGFASPLLHAGVLYVLDDSANMFAYNAESGKLAWQISLGTVGKGSPVWADGKIYAPEVNGRFSILLPSADKGVLLDTEQINMPEGRYAEIYASPAVGYGRVYVMTEAGLFCLGSKDAPANARSVPAPPAAVPAGQGQAASARIEPAEVSLSPGGTVTFKVVPLDAQGLPLPPATGEWSAPAGAGTVDGAGRFTAGATTHSQGGLVTWKGGGLTATARVRIFPALPWAEDFESMEAGKTPVGWVGGASRFQVADREGRKVLSKPFMDQGIERSYLFIGPPTMTGYTIQADLLGSVKGRKRPDMGLIAGGYTLDLMGNHQRLQVRDWIEPRMEKTIDFPWQPDTWYTMKLRARVAGDKAIIEGKVWPAGTPEPAQWSITAEDPVPIRQGSPGLYGYSAADIFYDNVKVMVSER